MQYNFEWDLDKAKANIHKHGVSFEQAAGIFLDPLQIVIFDKEHSEIEDRWVTLGKTNDGALLVVGSYISRTGRYCYDSGNLCP